LDALLEVYKNFGQFMPRFSENIDRLMKFPYLQRLLATTFEDLLDFHAEAIGYLTSSSKDPTPSVAVALADIHPFSNECFVRYKLANAGTVCSTSGE
jgi:hypothetical protein